MTQEVMEKILDKFLPIREGGRASRTKDEDFGLPETYIVTLKNDERQLVIKALQAYRADHG